MSGCHGYWNAIVLFSSRKKAANFLFIVCPLLLTIIIFIRLCWHEIPVSFCKLLLGVPLARQHFYCTPTNPRRADDNMAIMIILIGELISALKIKKIKHLFIELAQCFTLLLKIKYTCEFLRHQFYHSVFCSQLLKRISSNLFYVVSLLILC